MRAPGGRTPQGGGGSQEPPADTAAGDAKRGDAVVRRTRGSSGKVKLDEVARAAGVSTATVSRAFNEPDKVSDEIRERVFAVANALHWIPNAAGRALASSRTHIAGAIIPTLDNEVFARQINAMQAVMAGHGYTLFIGCSNYDQAEGLKQAQAMLARGVEALAFAGERHPAELFQALKARGLPYVVTYSYRADSPHCCVGFDNKVAFRRITRHLLELGHRRFGIISQPVADNDRVEARLAGINEELADAGLAVPEGRCLIGPGTLDAGAQGLARLMDSPKADRPTAVICGNDNLALGALACAPFLGLRAPDDFSITGFDDLAISSRLSPRLTTMRVDNHAIGAIAAEKLLWSMGHKGKAAEPRELVPDLIVRDTSGPPSGD
ncbi:LacI family DNA-binding transcriptional regulator [Consotaella salsifontis]|uniref:Transcriptional regulator, LacI family n=1 Tax=Consotaella salsifontis TaxID=1365950 RepID=A0A1T4SP06_9HYPH|nr:LacI family DNA-binding transcriptional regulator [Consotaella salsifontis]SKA29912.1 transcriptional regulator, LacI family [Consotaella salsifontis]